MKENILHVAYTRGNPAGPCYNGSRKTTLIVETARCVDYLSPDIWLYFGERVTTKAQLRANKAAILADANEQRPAKWPPFTHVVIQ
jgi:hypothetical protein